MTYYVRTERVKFAPGVTLGNESVQWVGFPRETTACDALMEDFIDDICCTGTGDFAGKPQPHKVEVLLLSRVSALYKMYFDDGSLWQVHRTVTDHPPEPEEHVDVTMV